MKTLNKTLLDDCKINNAEMRAINGGSIIDSIATGGKHGDGSCVVDVLYVHDDESISFEWEYCD